jgi:glycosyltransferase involved in cell wall biosynthesis
MKIAFIFNTLSNTGTNITTRDLIYQLKKSYSTDVDVYYFDTVEDELDVNSARTKVKFLDKIDFSGYDIVHSSNFRSDIYAWTKKLFKSRKNRPKFVTSVHSVIEQDFIYTYGKFMATFVAPFWLFLKKSNDAIFVSSDSMFQHYRDLFRGRNVHTIEYGRSKDPLVDFAEPADDIQKIGALKKNYRIIGTVGSLIKRKNYATTLTLLKKYPDTAWICLGLGEEKDALEGAVKENGLEDRVLFLGFRTDSRPYYKYFDLFFHPSRSEGFPLVVIDAMANSIPMMLSNLAVYKSTLKEDMAFYFELDDDTSLFQAYEKLLQPALVKDAIAKTDNVYADKFSMESYARRHQDVFTALLGSGK